MRTWVLAVALALLCGSRGFADPDAQAATRLQTFVVQSMLDDRRADIGSGVVVARDAQTLTLATVAHVLNPGRSLRILDASRLAYYQVLDVRVVPGYDLALIRVIAHPEFPVQPAAIAGAQSGESVWVWGNPGENFWTLSNGTVQSAAATIGKNVLPRVTILCASCTFGDSGGGVFSKDGKLVGILSAGWRDASGRVRFIEVEPAAPIARELAIARADPLLGAAQH